MEINIESYNERYWDDICRIHDQARKIELQYASLEDAFLPLEDVAETEGLFEYKHLDVALLDNKVVGFCAYSEDELAWLYVLPEKRLYESFGFKVKEILSGEMPGNERFAVKVYSMYRNISGGDTHDDQP